MEAKNVRVNLFPFHSKMETLPWAIGYMKNLCQSHVIFTTDCSQLVKTVLEPEKWPSFASYLEDIKILKESFIGSAIIHVPRTQNIKADKIARSAKNQGRRSYGCGASHLVYRVSLSLFKLIKKKDIYIYIYIYI